MLLRLFIAAILWSPARKGLTSWLSFAMFNCVFDTFPRGILDQLLYLSVSVPDLCHLSYYDCPPFSLRFVIIIFYKRLVFLDT